MSANQPSSAIPKKTYIGDHVNPSSVRIIQLAILAVMASSLASLGLAATASATTLQAERRIGLRDYYSPQRTINRCEAVAGGKLAVAGVFERNYLRSTGSVRWGSRNRLATAIVNSPARHTSKSALRWHRQPVKGSFPVATAFSDDGGFLQLTLIDRKYNRAGYLYELRIVDPNGRAVRSFSRDGKLRLRAPDNPTGTSVVNFRLFSMRDGGVIVAHYSKGRLSLQRYTRRGAHADWGTAGTATFAADSPFKGLPGTMMLPLSETIDGGVLIVAKIGGRDAIVKLNSRGEVDESFGEGGHWLPPNPGPPANGAQSTATVIGGVDVSVSGQVAVLYAAQQNYPVTLISTFHTALLNPDGGGQQLSPPLGVYSLGGDGGFPDAVPSDFKFTPSGVVLAFAETSYPTYTNRLYATKWIPNSNTTTSLYKDGGFTRAFGVGSFAISNSGDSIHACGSYGTVKTKFLIAKHLGVLLISIG